MTTRDVDSAEAIAILRAGGLVAIPTETVYGLAARADEATSVDAIFAAKGRPRAHPLIVHLALEASLDDWAIEVPEAALISFPEGLPGFAFRKRRLSARPRI